MKSLLALKRKQKKQRQKERRRQEENGKNDPGEEKDVVSDDEESIGSDSLQELPATRASRLNALGFDEDELGFNAEEYETALKVTDRLAQNLPHFRSAAFKQLRAAMHPLVEDQMKKYGVKGSLKRKRKDVTELQSLKEQDKEWINKAALRAKRLAALEELNNAAPALTNGSAPLLLTHMGEVQEMAAQVRLHRVADGTVELDEEEEKSSMMESPRRLNIPIQCYICKRPFVDLHFFYDQLCPNCASLNYRKRNELVEMEGKVALVTGARVKIGFRCALKLLRCGCTVIATSRFAADCARRYAQEKDFEQWKDRLHCVGMDFRDLASVEQFCSHMRQKFPRLDILINNACQTIRRPAQYYRHLLQNERKDVNEHEPAVQKLLHMHETMSSAKQGMLLEDKGTLPGIKIEEVEEEDEEDTDEANSAGSPEKFQEKVQEVGSSSRVREESNSSVTAKIPTRRTAAEMSQLVVTEEDMHEDTEAFPKSEGGTSVLDINQQQLDLRRKNSWMLRLDEGNPPRPPSPAPPCAQRLTPQQVSTGEMAEVMAINAIAPAILNARLKTLMEASPDRPRFIVNVSAMEGKFYRYKSDQHPHTNMAKAALNMMTRTSAQDYVKSDIYMTAVDTGWINDEKPMEIAAKHGERHNFQTPLDEVDAAARVLDPIIAPLIELREKDVKDVNIPHGVFLKDFFKCEW